MMLSRSYPRTRTFLTCDLTEKVVLVVSHVCSPALYIVPDFVIAQPDEHCPYVDLAVTGGVRAPCDVGHHWLDRLCRVRAASEDRG